ncbi:MAG: NAD(P)H-hydrate dehydratase [Kiloniellaceae bacterium]
MVANFASNAALSVAEMSRADAAAMARGVAGVGLMENAGRAVAEAARAHWQPCPVVVLCGPGNNGGDGFVAARHLAAAGWPVRLALLGARDKLAGDAAHHAGLWDGPVEPLDPDLSARLLHGAGLVIDALFGAGLSRPLDGTARAAAEAVNAAGRPVVAVDVPSGLSGDTGEALGGLAIKAARSVTFFRKKPGHLLLPGRMICGAVEVADIGIPDSVLADIAPKTAENGPALWGAAIPRRRLDSHKYRFGHVLIQGGAVITGAGRLAARAALRVGAGLVTVACSRESLPIYALSMPSLITAPAAGEADFAALLEDRRKNAVLIGPGNGVGAATRKRALAALGADKAVVLDADALTSFQRRPAALFDAIRGPCVLTPHEGEFGRLFPDLKGDKLTRARAAARQSGAVLLLKGADSVIADPDGRAAINANAPPELATAGTGDVLSGLVAGLLAQGMNAFDAACAAAWLHGEAAAAIGPGLIAEDLPEALTGVLRRLL